jgi:CDP-diacylglycerol--serine O-phosphatidyltransferase
VDRVFMTALLVGTFVLSYLMISTIRYRSFKDLDLKRRRPASILLAIALVFAAFRLRPTLALLTIAVVFAASGPVTRLFLFLRRKSAPPAAAA